MILMSVFLFQVSVAFITSDSVIGKGIHVSGIFEIFFCLTLEAQATLEEFDLGRIKRVLEGRSTNECECEQCVTTSDGREKLDGKVRTRV